MYADIIQHGPDTSSFLPAWDNEGMTIANEEESVPRVGRRLRSLRVGSDLTLRQLAEKSDVAFTTIQKIESGAISPTVGILMKIARGLQVRMTALLEEESEAHHARFIKKKKRFSVSGRKQDIEIQYIAQNLADPEIFGFCILVGPGEGSGPEPLSHGGEEIVIGVQGTMVFLVGEDEYTVSSGDCLHFKCSIPHKWINRGKGLAKFYLICSESGLTPAPPDQI